MVIIMTALSIFLAVKIYKACATLLLQIGQVLD